MATKASVVKWGPAADGKKGSAVCYAPLQQEMGASTLPTQQQLQYLRSKIEAKEAELYALTDQLQQRELLHQSTQGAPAAHDAAGEHDQGTASSQLQRERALLLTRWQCLLQDKAQLTAMMRWAQGHLADFEPGDAPMMRDVTCSVITHQLDTPFFSCCFQR